MTRLATILAGPWTPADQRRLNAFLKETKTMPTPAPAPAKKLSIAMVRALERFAQPGGSDYGFRNHPATVTAEALERRGLVTLYSRSVGTCSGRCCHGEATHAGLDELRRRGLLPPDPLDERDEYPLGYMQGRGAPVGCGG